MGAVVAKRKQRWETIMGRDRLDFADTAGRVGLRNLGNTCFMNAGLQCLCHLEPFVAYFLTGKHREETNRTNPLGSGGKLAEAIAGLQRELWQKRQASYNPRTLHSVLKRCSPYLFEGYEQQDVQEFLVFCLDGLHEDLNLVTKRQPPAEDTDEADARLAAEHGEEYLAALSWMRHLSRGKSFLVDLFQGQLRSSLTCTECGHRRRCFEPFLYLSVPVPAARGRASDGRVTDAIEKYLEEEMLTGNERWMCPRCKKKVDTRKKMDLWKLPPILVLHLKRFEFDARSSRFRKLDSLLTAPLTMDLMPYVSSPQREHATYDVVGVANHIGAFGSGHYTAYCRVGASGGDDGGAGAWHHFNDDRVSAISPEEVISRNSYVIFLVRHAGEGQQIRRQTVSLPEVWPHWISTRNQAISDLAAGDRSAGNGLPNLHSIVGTSAG